MDLCTNARGFRISAARPESGRLSGQFERPAAELAEAEGSENRARPSEKARRRKEAGALKRSRAQLEGRGSGAQIIQLSKEIHCQNSGQETDL
jgi:hypothetical protein